MYINIDFTLPENIQEQIKQETIETATEILLKEDKTEMRRMIQECVRGALKANITELLQGKDFKNFLRDKIAEEIGLND